MTETTKLKRQVIKNQLDSFATFVWRGDNSFDKHGVFIVADKRGDLKFYNGPTYSNEYTKPQFSASSGELTGVSFNRQKISFKIAMYWFSISEWQDFIEWINPYEVNYLTFSFEDKYGYLVKLSKIADSPRYIVGYENSEPRYYTELTLDWDLQGESCVRSVSAYEWEYNTDSRGDSISISLNEIQEANKTSRLETPILISFPITRSDDSNINSKIEMRASYDGIDEGVLFSVELKNLPVNSKNITDSSSPDDLNLDLSSFYYQNVYYNYPTIQYDSETGVLLYKQGNVNWKLLHLNLLDNNGDYLVNTFSAIKYKLKGKINLYQFKLYLTNIKLPEDPVMHVYERTNVI